MIIKRRGALFVLEGGDGSGKATQADILHKKLLRAGYDSKILDFPRYGNNVFADTVKAYLEGEFGDPTQISPYLISPHYAADRDLAAPEIREAIERGTILVSNRYVSANAGHQGAKIENPQDRALFLEWNRAMEYSQRGFNIPRPDLTILLDMPPELSAELTKNRALVIGTTQDGHEKNTNYKARVTEVFREIATHDPAWRVISCIDQEGKILPEGITSDKVWETVKPYLPPKFSSS